jgi:hypothetical protein
MLIRLSNTLLGGSHMRRTLLFSLPLLFWVIPANPHGSPDQLASGSSPVKLIISGPLLIHAGQALNFKATLLNRSAEPIAIPIADSCPWCSEGGHWWKITDKFGKPLAPRAELLKKEIPIDNVREMPRYHDRDFVVLKPGEKIEYDIKNIGDPSDDVVFPGKGIYLVSLSWSFHAPEVNHLPNGNISYRFGVTSDMSPAIEEVLLRTPRFEVQSNVWTMSLR